MNNIFDEHFNWHIEWIRVITKPTLLGLSWKYWLGLSALVVVLQWLPLYQIHPLFVLYPIWITGCAMYAWAAWTRQSRLVCWPTTFCSRQLTHCVDTNVVIIL
jgi:hypothetical protein